VAAGIRIAVMGAAIRVSRFHWDGPEAIEKNLTGSIPWEDDAAVCSATIGLIKEESSCAQSERYYSPLPRNRPKVQVGVYSAHSHTASGAFFLIHH
jgi:hypothetical protein